MKPVMGLNNWRRLIRLPWAVSNCCETNRLKLDKVVKVCTLRELIKSERGLVHIIISPEDARSKQ